MEAFLLQAWVLALVFGIGMLFIDAVLIILRLTQLDKSQAQKQKQLDRQPLGVRIAAGGTSVRSPLPRPQPAPSVTPDSDTPSVSGGTVPSRGAEDADLAAAQRALDSLLRASGVASVAEKQPEPPVPADAVFEEPSVASSPSGVRRRRRAD